MNFEIGSSDIAEIIADIAGFHGGLHYLRDRSPGLPLRFNNKRMRKEYGNWEYVTLHDGLRAEIEDIKRGCTT